MKKTLLTFAIILSASISYACLCHSRMLAKQIVSADCIFIGTVLKKNTLESAYYLFSVSETLKGAKVDTITIKTGFGGGDCGIHFEIGSSYLVCATNKETNSCSINRLLDSTIDIRTLKNIFKAGSVDSLGKNDYSFLSNLEADFLNLDFIDRRNGFNFFKMKIAFVLDGIQIDKRQYFMISSERNLGRVLITLAIDEKGNSNGYDAVIYCSKPENPNRIHRKKLLKMLK